jgi:diguanylate cyclase (GGDEF)-like protein/PAS domain S-box-containing protein
MSEEGPVETASSAPSASAVLVVGDDAATRGALCAMLAPLGRRVLEADSAEAALRAVADLSFAVVLMDLRVPGLNGYETAKLIRRSGSERTPIIFVTEVECDQAEMAVAYASGAVEFVFAPVVAEALQAKVMAFLDIDAQDRKLQRSLEYISVLNVALRDSEVRARTVLQNVADAIVTASEDGLIESFNRSARRLFGYTDDEVIGRPLDIILAPGHRDGIPLESVETVGCRKDGSCFAMEMDMSQMKIDERTFTIGCIRDISGRKAYLEALESRMLHDELTGLPNRALFGDRVDQALARADRANEPRGVLLVDVDDLRAVNEGRGRQDAVVVKAVAERLAGAMPASDTVARLAGNQFGILPAGVTDVETAAGIAWKVREVFEGPFVVDGRYIELRASIGVALFPQHGRTTDDLLRRADMALRQAKRSGSGLAAFVEEPDDQTARRLTLLSELRDGIARGELVLHFQPKIDLATRRTTGVEALVRWLHPGDGLLMPAQFMPEAARSELIEPLTNWVLDKAFEQHRRWRDAGLDLTMAVNVSARSLTYNSTLPDTIAQLTQTWGLARGALILEITENAIVDADAPVILDLLHAMGERVAIDDFGTGHSSLVYLQRLPIDQIKVDRSFVMNLATAPSDAVIVRSTIDLAHNLDLTVVAEGVEDKAALDMLIDYGCDSAQGYFFSRPCAAGELTRWLADSPFGAARSDDSG